MAMPPPVQNLLGAVRRRLWRGQFTAGVRRALWGSAGLMLLAVAVHLSVGPVPAGAMLSALIALWAAMLAWAGRRRPSDAACALWADRHLGGASAFTTWLETRRHGPAANAQAVRWLEHWVTARVPQGLRLLAERPEPAQLSRPFAFAGVCAALSALVLTLPDPSPASRQPAAARPASSHADRNPLQGAEWPASADVVSEMAGALRSAASREAPERRAGSQAPAAAPGKTDDVDATQESQTSTTPGDGRGADRGEAPGTTADAGRATGTTAGTGSGRQAGDSRDDRVDVGISRAPQGTMAVQRLDSRVRPSLAGKQVDLERSADYDDRLPTPGAALRVVSSAAAATPPPATELARLGPTEATYVRAWMNANAARR